MSGFTAAGLEGFHSLKPAAVVRELIQNSLDAAQEAGQEVARVRFELGQLPTDDIPGIKAYRGAFDNAVRDQKEKQGGELPDAANSTVQVMEEALGQQEQQMLYVLDNGIGLDTKRMEGLLADGLSVKEVDSSGSVGNGHLVAIPASNLRYVLYGGRLKDGQSICAGHAVLASHQAENQLKSKDGFYVKELQGLFHEPYLFPENEEIPDCIQSKLDWIAQESELGSGTVVAITAFNDFREDKRSLWEVVSKAAACNFFAALHAGKLSVEVVEENGSSRVLDASSVGEVLREASIEKRARSGFISGSAADSALRVLREGKELNTEVYGIRLKVMEKESGGLSRIDLCRNGMWITMDLPGVGRGQFADKKPFHCVVLLDNQVAQVHTVVRKSEGPLHNDLAKRKWLNPREKGILKQAMADIRQAIQEEVAELSTEEFISDEHLTLPMYGEQTGGYVGKYAGIFEKIGAKAIPRTQLPGGRGSSSSGGGNKSKGGSPRKRRQGRPLPYRALFVPQKGQKGRIRIQPTEDIEKAELQFVLDESLDASCDYRPADEQIVELKSAEMGGEEVKLSVDEKNKKVAVPLGDLRQGEAVEVNFDYKLPKGVAQNTEVVLKAQLVKPITS